jgi:hypothetical protein
MRHYEIEGSNVPPRINSSFETLEPILLGQLMDVGSMVSDSRDCHHLDGMPKAQASHKNRHNS